MSNANSVFTRVLPTLLAVSVAVNIALVLRNGHVFGQIGAESEPEGQTVVESRAVLDDSETQLAAEPEESEGAAESVYSVMRGDAGAGHRMVATGKSAVRESLFASFYSAPTDIVFLGDSLTEQFEWGDVFPEYRVKNRGITGDTTGNIAARLDSVVVLEPEKIFMMAGVNDVGSGVNPQKILQNYEGIVAALLEQLPGAELYVLSMLPADGLPNVNNRVVYELNGQLMELCERYGVIYIDLFSRMALDDLSLNPQYHYDNLHLNANGYAVWVEEILPHVYGSP